MRHLMAKRTARMAWLLAVVGVIACGQPQQGPGQATAPPPSPSTMATAHPAGAEDAGRSSFREEWWRATWSHRERSSRGLAISPVQLDTSTMTARQRAQVGLGSYLVNAAGDCAGCHSSQAGFLAGGVPFVLDAKGSMVWTRNLTPDPVTGMQLSLDQFKEAIRTGRDFRHPASMLVVMPWLYLRWESEADLEAIYAYLRAVPAVSNQVPADSKDALPLPPSLPFPGRYTDGDVVRDLPSESASFDPRRGLAIAPLAWPDLEDGAARRYGIGSYLANATIACNECHTHPDRSADGAHLNTAGFLTGGTVYATPPPLLRPTGYVRATSANLKGASEGFFSEPNDSFARFQAIMHTGTLVDQAPPRPLAFPMSIIAGSLRNLVDEDLRALYAYLKGTRSTTGASDVAHQAPARWCQATSDCHGGETCDSGQCVGGACATSTDCGTCQTCGSGTCQAPAADSVCVATEL
jgi:mono/diheme cytochrome c family protein